MTPTFELLLRSEAHKHYDFKDFNFQSHGSGIFAHLRDARAFTEIINGVRKSRGWAPHFLSSITSPIKTVPLRVEDAFAMGLIKEILHYVLKLYTHDAFSSWNDFVLENASSELGPDKVEEMVHKFWKLYPSGQSRKEKSVVSDVLEEAIILWVVNKNPGFKSANDLFEDVQLEKDSSYGPLLKLIIVLQKEAPTFGPENQGIVEMLRSPALAHPESLQKQLEYMRDQWGHLLGPYMDRLLRSIDFLQEVNSYWWRSNMGWGSPTTDVIEYERGMEEYEAFSADREWMPKVVLLAKSTLVWMYQLSKTYGYQISTLDQIPEQELDIIASRGFNALWLIGIWQRSEASRTIKNWSGNPDAAPSAYSLFDYDIASELGGWPALETLRSRCAQRGIRLASDMVPNHTGIDSKWVHEHPDWFVQLSHSPYNYNFNTGNLSSREDIGIYLDEGYYTQKDAAVVFKRVNNRTHEERYIYHGNDGTHMPWNDTAQLNYLNPEVREAAIQTILHVARNFPIIRFDAAMTLAKKHFQRLWFPEPGHGGDIASRAEHGLSHEQFNKAMPNEFWREVVDRAAVEAPDTLLLAEAFWMMESYFVRTLGMHRVYNSAFMNMLKMEENAKYRQVIKNTIKFDKDILKRFVNFMNNPDEDTAAAQFGKGDKYFGVATLLSTLPGLPMFGHGQIEGFEEKYGMEYTKAYYDESPNDGLIAAHDHQIFPLLKQRYIFAGVENFLFYDFFGHNGLVNENVYAYSNGTGGERAVVAYNNSYEQVNGRFHQSCEYLEKHPDGSRTTQTKTIADALGLYGGQGRYLIFQEQRSGLWYIRNSEAIIHQGMWLALNGYQSQIFIHCHELEDGNKQLYRRAHDELGGSGVPDLWQYLKELEYGHLYVQVKAILKGVTNNEDALVGEALVKELEGFYQQCSGLGFAPVPPVSLRDLSKKVADRLETALGLDGLENEPMYRLLSFILLSDLSDFVEEWGLYIAVASCWKDKHQLFQMLRLVNSVDYAALVAKKRSPLKQLFSAQAERAAMERLFQLHRYDGVLYCNKESMDLYLSTMAQLLAVDGKNAGIQYSELKKEERSLAQQAEKMGYDFEKLVEKLVPKKTESRTGTKKATTRKKPTEK